MLAEALLAAGWKRYYGTDLHSDRRYLAPTSGCFHLLAFIGEQSQNKFQLVLSEMCYSIFLSCIWLLLDCSCVFVWRNVNMFQQYMKLMAHFLGFSLWVSVHKEMINTHQSDKCVLWAMEQKATHQVLLELLPSRDSTPLTGKWIKLNSCSCL